jgi:TRAP-type C4-dicarboxylate transport system permease small subunit
VLQDLRPALDAMPPETRRAVRTVGALLAGAALLLAFAAAAQTAAYGPQTETGGTLAWVFALFVGAAVLAVFLVVLSLVRTPSRRPGSRLPGTARER